MRWKEVRLGDTREVTKFLLLSRCIQGQRRWLERATYLQTLVWNPAIACHALKWENTKWIDKPKPPLCDDQHGYQPQHTGEPGEPPRGGSAIQPVDFIELDGNWVPLCLNGAIQPGDVLSFDGEATRLWPNGGLRKFLEITRGHKQ